MARTGTGRPVARYRNLSSRLWLPGTQLVPKPDHHSHPRYDRRHDARAHASEFAASELSTHAVSIDSDCVVSDLVGLRFFGCGVA
jgi:hypothetical protein